MFGMICYDFVFCWIDSIWYLVSIVFFFVCWIDSLLTDSSFVLCADIDECSETDSDGDELHECDQNGVCENTDGGYNCSCKTGFRGDGFNCSSECQKELQNFQKDLQKWDLFNYSNLQKGVSLLSRKLAFFLHLISALIVEKHITLFLQ